LLIATLALTPLLKPPALAQSGIIFRITPASLQVAVNSTVDVAVEVLNAPPAYSFYTLVSFDPNIVEVVDVNPDVIDVQVAQGQFFAPGATLRNKADNATGLVEYGMTQLNPTPPTDAGKSGALIILRLRGKKEGSAQITIQRMDFGLMTNTLAEGEKQNGAVQVLATVAGPTNTNIPTQNPGTVVPPQVTDVVVGPTPTGPRPTDMPTSTLAPQPTATKRSGGGGSPGGGVSGGGAPAAATATQAPVSGSAGQAAVAQAPAAAPVTATPMTVVVTTTPAPAPPAPAGAPAQPTPSPEVITIVITATPQATPTEAAAAKSGYAPAPAKPASSGAGAAKSGSSKQATEQAPNYGLWMGAVGLLIGFLLAVVTLRRRKSA
jgi:hypothetical protein